MKPLQGGAQPMEGLEEGSASDEGLDAMDAAAEAEEASTEASDEDEDEVCGPVRFIDPAAMIRKRDMHSCVCGPSVCLPRCPANWLATAVSKLLPASMAFQGRREPLDVLHPLVKQDTQTMLMKASAAAHKYRSPIQPPIALLAECCRGSRRNCLGWLTGSRSDPDGVADGTTGSEDLNSYQGLRASGNSRWIGMQGICQQQGGCSGSKD